MMSGLIFEYLKLEHAFPLLVVIYLNLMLFYLMGKIGLYRKKHDIRYPTVYHKTDDLFNCYQRAHMNTLEGLPIFYSLFIPSAIVYPVFASVLGAIFVTSRFFYAHGYYTGDPDKRSRGSWGEIGVLGLFLLVIYITLCQFGLVDYYV